MPLLLQDAGVDDHWEALRVGIENFAAVLAAANVAALADADERDSDQYYSL